MCGFFPVLSLYFTDNVNELFKLAASSQSSKPGLGKILCYLSMQFGFPLYSTFWLLLSFKSDNNRGNNNNKFLRDEYLFECLSFVCLFNFECIQSSFIHFTLTNKTKQKLNWILHTKKIGERKRETQKKIEYNNRKAHFHDVI